MFLLPLLFRLLVSLVPATGMGDLPVVKIGLISPLTGPLAPFASSEGTILAIEELNAAGGIGGRKIELIIEDGKCQGSAAAAAAQKLVAVDGVKYILGGQCSIETLAIAPILNKARVVTIASTSSSPEISEAGPYIFRTSASSLKQGVVLAEYAYSKAGYRNVSMLSEETPYAEPITASFQREFLRLGGKLKGIKYFNSATADFRSLLAPIGVDKSEALVIVAQSIPLAAQVVRQLSEIKLDLPLLGSETTGNVPSTWPQYSSLFEGMVFAQPDYQLTGPLAVGMIGRYNKRFGGTGLKYPYQAEAYDAANILVKTIERCGDDVELVRQCLEALKDFPGVTGKISFDENGDATHSYVLGKIDSGKTILLDN